MTRIVLKKVIKYSSRQEREIQCFSATESKGSHFSSPTARIQTKREYFLIIILPRNIFGSGNFAYPRNDSVCGKSPQSCGWGGWGEQRECFHACVGANFCGAQGSRAAPSFRGRDAAPRSTRVVCYVLERCSCRRQLKAKTKITPIFSAGLSLRSPKCAFSAIDPSIPFTGMQPRLHTLSLCRSGIARHT